MKFLNLTMIGLFGVFCAAVLLYQFLLSKDDLHIDFITSQIPARSEWEMSSMHLEDLAKVDLLLSQPFIYLGEGGQAYVFSSADQQYVLKLFKFRRLRPSVSVRMLPDVYPFKSYRDKHIAKRQNKLMTAFNGHKLAYDRHRQESGLIFVQLNPTSSSKVISVSDKKNRTKTIKLDNVSYVIQKKGEMLSRELSTLLQQDKLADAKQLIDQVFQLYLSEYRKGIYDLDYGVMHNIGSVEGIIFHLDVGKLTADERIKQPEFYQGHLIKTAVKLQAWIHQHYPAYSPELTQYIEERLSQILDRSFTFSQTT